ncbi:hypothetical protein RHECNPAF_3500081 [Rhizobium etli CNPAF512]|nr:hypothetical protein RHECNPAF_3500081 [Rhizobium etli CNPAF512]
MDTKSLSGSLGATGRSYHFGHRPSPGEASLAPGTAQSY